MAIVIEAVRPEDLTDFISVLFQAHQGRNHYLNSVFPDNLEKEGQNNALSKIQVSLKATDCSKWEKAIDASTGEIVGVAIWSFFETRTPLDAPSAKKTTENTSVNRSEVYGSDFRTLVTSMEGPFWRENPLPLISLFALAVSPAYQHKGVGSALMTSGLKQADSMGAKVSVVATDNAGGFYEKIGFKVLRHMSLEVPEEFKDEEKVWFYFLVRESKIQPKTE